ncbi:amino acid adenylation domain-containing protein [Streptomyces spongiicola]|uniref:Amino acid adenylation domain-containing protein n=1 Tax=Streptomyces spongiicola TaxID=1690221 RepID=A0A388T5R5_9ACTN|nr:amino acid adenylation domain-containing protein [Streptomyces spongiicola]GBQ03542.1 amino acid adenylation domain-containing protein [Streptomyces spongiicola]
MTFEAIHDLVGRTIGRSPDQVAVETPQGALGYAELDARAAHVADALKAAGAGAGAFVPVLVRDRRDLVAAVLGILRIGGVFVPLDLAAPPTRLRATLLEVAPEWAVVGSPADPAALQALSEAAPTARTVTAGPAASPGVRREHHRSGADDPAYVFFTSGTTGRPKGIVGRLGSIAPYIRWETGLLGVEPGWRVSQLVSPSFDAVLRDLFVPLTTGGTIVVPPPETVLDPAALARWTDEERIDLVHTVPSLFRGLVSAAIAGDRTLGSLRWVALSGERLATSDAELLFGRYGDRIRLLNLYGPSETTMTKTFHVVTRQDLARPSIPVGRPIPDAEVLLVDEHGRPAEPGTVGEIHLRTPHRSLGYHGHPRETARAFVPHPVTGDRTDLVYRTGDYGRLLDDGALEFLGRKDHQVKIGGVRVELEGVECVLRDHPAVADAAVVAVEEAGAAHLRAYLELRDAPAGTAPEAFDRELRGYLRERLPESAVPARFVPLAELPRTLSGKIDRRALPAPSPRTADRTAGEPPRTTTERTVAVLWLRTLPVSGAGRDDDFFASGGTSLLVVSLLALVNQTFAVTVPLRDFLLSPTVAGLAAAVEKELLAADAPLDDLFAIQGPDLR